MINKFLFSISSSLTNFSGFLLAELLLVTRDLTKPSRYVHQYFYRQLCINFDKFAAHFLFPK